MRSSVLLFLLVGSAGCDAGAQCGSTQGFVSGRVDGTGPPIEVLATGAGLNAIFTAEVAADGTYELNVEGGLDYTIWAEDAAGCASEEHELRIDACTERELDLVVDGSGCTETAG